MKITIGLWVIPTVATVAMLIMMFRPYRSSGAWDFCSVFRLFWLIPILFVWVVFFAALLIWEGLR